MICLHTDPLPKQQTQTKGDSSSVQAPTELCDTYIYTHVLTHADAHRISFLMQVSRLDRINLYWWENISVQL